VTTRAYVVLLCADTYYQLAAMPGRHPDVPPLTDAQLQALQAYR
jgi:hypothetical protein